MLFASPVASTKLAAFAFLCLTCRTSSPLGAQETVAPAATMPATQQQAATSAAADKQASSSEALFPAPQDDAKGLLQFIKEVANRQPEQQGEPQRLAHQRKVARSVAAASDQAIKLKPLGALAAEIHFFRLQSLTMLQQMQEPDAGQRLERAISAARQSHDPQVVGIGMKFYVKQAFALWHSKNPDQKQAFIAATQAHFTKSAAEVQRAQALMTVVDFLIHSGDTDLANQLLEKTLPHFQQATSLAVQEQASVLAGIQRRINLKGKQIKLAGTRLNGQRFDWKTYQGKVVLVDFWSSSCGPCRAELPSLLRHYRAYHDKGFEVVGICLDEQPQTAKHFIAQRQLPWATLYSFDPQHRAWDDPRAVEFGITALPFVMLLDRDGRVAHLNARGEHLTTALQELLGEPVSTRNTTNRQATAKPQPKTRRDRSVVPASSVEQ